MLGRQATRMYARHLRRTKRVIRNPVRAVKVRSMEQISSDEGCGFREILMVPRTDLREMTSCQPPFGYLSNNIMSKDK